MEENHKYKLFGGSLTGALIIFLFIIAATVLLFIFISEFDIYAVIMAPVLLLADILIFIGAGTSLSQYIIFDSLTVSVRCWFGEVKTMRWSEIKTASLKRYYTHSRYSVKEYVCITLDDGTADEKNENTPYNSRYGVIKLPYTAEWVDAVKKYSPAEIVTSEDLADKIGI